MSSLEPIYLPTQCQGRRPLRIKIRNNKLFLGSFKAVAMVWAQMRANIGREQAFLP